jgi:hypothetical protein
VERERSILLGDPPPQPEEQFEWSFFKEKENGGYIKAWRVAGMRYEETLRIILRDDDPNYRCERRTVTQESAVVQYADILDATEVERDADYHERPWENCDGWNHEFVTDTSFWPDFDRTQMRGYVRSTQCTDSGIIETTVKDMMLSTWEDHHKRGASKQVARELEAEGLRKAIDQLVKWYEEGWEWFGVKCEYLGAEASVWGVDDEDYANEYVRDEIAGEVSHELERDGWLVEGQPQPSGLKYGWSLDAWRSEYQRRLASFNVEGR